MKAKTILLVEDEDQVRVLLERVLIKNQYSVITAANGREAVDIARDRMSDIDLVISDLVMPELGGGGLLRELRKLRSDLPFLYMTGYTEEEVESEGPLEGAHVIQKPFTPVQLMQRVQQII